MLAVRTTLAEDFRERSTVRSTVSSLASDLGRWAVVTLAVARLTRFVTTDWLGEWTVAGPAKRWAWRHEAPVSGWLNGNGEPHTRDSLADSLKGVDPVPSPEPGWGWRSKLAKGLDCPFCVGFWLGVLALLGETTLGRIPVVSAVWRFGVAAFALNYVVGHVSKKIDS